MTDLTEDAKDFTVTLSGEDWWRILRVLTGEAPVDRDLANSVSGQLWDSGSAQMNVSPSNVENTLGFIDQTIYANVDSDPSVKWRNGEVINLLNDIRRMVTGDGVGNE